MHEITSPKIEKHKAEMEKTKAKIVEFQAKYREQEKQLRVLEDFEIVARFREHRLDEGYKATLQAEKEQTKTAEKSAKIKEGTSNDENKKD
jgi:hypothetical protein